MSFEPPPTYSQEDPDAEQVSLYTEPRITEPHLLIVPTANTVGFQSGYLGADGERASIEGEVQLKGPDGFHWDQVTMSLRTLESADGADIELANSEMTVSSGGTASRSSFPFCIALPLDTPQCVHTSNSHLTHTLSATVLAGNSVLLTKSLVVHTRRYTGHAHSLSLAPETRVLDDPTRIEVQVPRTTFKVGEPVPIYITIPSPRRELVLDEGMRLRNVRAELVRLIKVKRQGDDEDDSDLGSEYDYELLSNPSQHDGHTAGPSAPPIQKRIEPSTSGEGVDFRTFTGVHGEKKVIALSGASCRLHPSRALRIRLLLHRPVDSPAVSFPELPGADPYAPDAGPDCASISQTTILHRVSFVLRVRTTFVNMKHHTERVSTVSIPVVMLPPTSSLPEVEESIDTAYHKKHDRPPLRTNRLEEMDAPQYDEAGPSGAPPPFEEREAPPPFSFAGPEASTSSRLPTFFESEREILVPLAEHHALDPPRRVPELVIEGEGTVFGFTASEQFDGYADDVHRSYSPPPTLEMASRDTDVTSLADMGQDASTVEALGLTVEHHDELTASQFPPPPPPPPMDDPSDPPPSIDSDFRMPGDTQSAPPRLISPPPGLAPPGLIEEGGHPPIPPSDLTDGSHGHAPPPYRVPDHVDDDEHDEHAAGPPPYVDLVPRHS